MDNLTREQRRRNMQCIKSCDTSIEIKLRRALWQKGLRYRKNYKKLPGKPDIALTKYKIAIFCDSEFFHGKDWEVLKPRLEQGNNSQYWVQKIEKNIERDDEINKQLLFMGWTVIRFWGKEISRNVDECVKVVGEKCHCTSQRIYSKNVNMREVNIVKGINRTYETKSKLHFSDLRIFSTDR